MFKENIVSVTQSQILFETLASKIYRDPTVSSYREVIANALDIHRQVGQNKKPTLTIEPASDALPFTSKALYVTVRDYGTGISDEDYSEVYLTFFKTTKTEADSGAHGLGAKTPFGISYKFLPECEKYNCKLSFYVNSYQNGVKTSYVNYVSDEGVPVYSKIGEFPTTEGDGLEVKFLHIETYNPFIDPVFVISFLDFIDVEIKTLDEDSQTNNLLKSFNESKNSYVRKRVTPNLDIVNFYNINAEIYPKIAAFTGYGDHRNSGILFKKGDIVYSPTAISHSNVIPRIKRPVGDILFVLNVNAIDDLEYSIPSSRESIHVNEYRASFDEILPYINNSAKNILTKNSFIDDLVEDLTRTIRNEPSIETAYKKYLELANTMSSKSILEYIRKNNITVEDILIRQQSNIVMPSYELTDGNKIELFYKDANTISGSFTNLSSVYSLIKNKTDVKFLIRDTKQYSHITTKCTESVFVFLPDCDETNYFLRTNAFVVDRISDFGKPIRKKRNTQVATGDLPRVITHNGIAKILEKDIDQRFNNSVPYIYIDTPSVTINDITFSADCSSGVTLSCSYSDNYFTIPQTIVRVFSARYNTSKKTKDMIDSYINQGKIVSLSDYVAEKSKNITEISEMTSTASLLLSNIRNTTLVMRFLFNDKDVSTYTFSNGIRRLLREEMDEIHSNGCLPKYNPNTFIKMKDDLRVALEDPLINEMIAALEVTYRNYPMLNTLFREKFELLFDTTYLDDIINLIIEKH